MIRCRWFGHRYRWYAVGDDGKGRVVLCERCGTIAAGSMVTMIGGGGSGGVIHVTDEEAA